jgi:glycerol transport system ATP-binding protein
VRPEYVRVAAGGEGLPARIARVEDVGRHKIVRLDINGQAINAIVGEETTLPSDGAVVQFDPAGINIYENDWRVTPKGEVA